MHRCTRALKVWRLGLCLGLGCFLLAVSGGLKAQNRAAELSRQSTPEYWRALGERETKKAIAEGGEQRQARNLILFLGDGMGVSTVTAARIYAGQKEGRAGEENSLAFETFPHTALVKTYNIDQQTPDSAGTMTAIITGVKTRAGVLSVDGRARRGDCESAQDRYLPTLLEEAETAGMATGLVSTARITHATPAAAYAHTPERNWESDADIPEQDRAVCVDIARQLVEFGYGDGIEVILGGGRRTFLPSYLADLEHPSKRGARKDRRNLIDEWLGDDRSAAYVWNQKAFNRISPLRTQRLLGLFEPSHMQFEADRAQDPGGEPSLAEMTAKAIAILKRRGQGYLLIVEAGRIDHAHHAANAHRALEDTVALSDAVAEAMATTGGETLIVVTADHSHTLTIGGYSVRGNDILGKVRMLDRAGQPKETPDLDGQAQPYTTLAYANGPGWRGATNSQPAGVKTFPHLPHTFDHEPTPRADLTDVDTHAKNYLQEGAIPLPLETHAGEDVVVYAKGPGAVWFHGVIEQSQIYWLMKAALKLHQRETP